MNEYELKANEAGSKAAEDLMKALNTMSYEKETIKGFVDTITRSHRTLQQSTMRSIFALMMQWADSHCDARNEATVKFCKNVKKMTADKNIHFPFI